jgi:hypothetical protein
LSKRLDEIIRRKRFLIEKAERERIELGAACAAIRSPLTITATLYGLGRLLKAYPLIATAVSSLLVSGYTGKVVKSSGQLLRLWKLTVPIRQWWKNRSTK